MNYDETLTIENICGGAVDERFRREVAEIIKNICDPNTPAEQKRTITLEFQFDPYKDRSGSSVTLICKSKMAAIEPVDGSVHFAKDGFGIKAYAHNPNQTKLFDAEGSKPQ